MQNLHSPQSLETPSPDTPGGMAYSDGGSQSKAWPWKPVLVGLGVGVALTLAGNHFWGGAAVAPPASVEEDVPPTAQASQTVAVAPVVPATVADTLAVTGTVQAVNLLSIAPQASGLQIQQVLVREGDAVAAGQVLALLDNSTLQADLRQAQAQLSVSQAQVTQRQAALAQAQANLAEAQQNLERLGALADQGAISQQELTRQQTQTTTAQQAVGLARAEVDSARAGVQSQRAAMDRLQTQIGQTSVRSPVAGVVAERRANVGDVSSPGSPIVTLIQNNQLKLVAEVPQTQLDRLAVGAAVAVSSTADSRLRLQGQVQSIDPLINATSRTAQVNISLPGSDLLRPGLFLRGDISTNTRQGLVIPATALQSQPDGTSLVFILGEGNQVTARPITLGNRLPSQGDQPARVEVVEGLQAGDQVITAGVGFLQDGDLVRIAP
ncbi:MAG: efflux RND transporter periplasmic adaptor subunit [Leptolyngbya sp.]|nr:efflux RND transporter periplasmic adaptor subunit [Leptolyngbya sp.]